jgi:hypothetical protein
MEEQAAAIGELRADVVALAAKVRDLKRKPGRNSGFSSMAPSADDLADALHGHARKRTMSALRSLFHISKSNGRIFRNPASGINGGTPACGVLVPLDQTAYDRAIQAATQPPARLMLALAAMHAARPHAIRHLSPDRHRPRRRAHHP